MPRNGVPDGFTALRVQLQDFPLEGAASSIQPVVNRLKVVDSDLVVGWCELDPDGDVGQQDL